MPELRPEYIEERSRGGLVVNRYLKGKLLGKGGFAKCYEAMHCGSSEHFAVKVISKTTIVKPKTRQKLKTEIKIHRSIGHKHIVGFKKYFEDEHNVYIMLELCKGQTLMEHCNRKGRFSEPETSYLIHQVLLALKYMHGLGVIHRDLKLGNIMLSGDMEAKIGDFGLAAKLYFAGEKRRTLCGTPNYIAPEILASGHGHSYEADVWTVGVIIFAMLVGKPPFQTGDVKSTYGKIKSCSFTFPSHIDISQEAKKLISSILQVSPEGRPTVEQLLEHPWFKLHPPSKIAPLSLFVPGTPRHAAQQHRLIDERRASLPSKPRREPLGRVDMNVMRSASAGGKLRAKEQQPAKEQQSPPYHVSPKIVQRYRSSVSPGASASPPPPPQVRSASAVGRREAYKPTYTTRMSSPRRVAACVPSITPPRSNSRGRAPTTSRSPSVPLSLRKPSATPVIGGADPAPQPTRDVVDNEDDKNLTMLRDKLEETLVEGKAPKAEPVVSSPQGPTLWVTEYADFTSKYGLAYRFSNGQIGVHFNDNTKIVYSPETSEIWYIMRNKVGVMQGSEQMTKYILGQHPEELNKKTTLVKYFSSYIAKMKGRGPKQGQSEVVTCSRAPLTESKERDIVYVRKWLHTADATIFRLSNKKVQVCFHDSTEILLTSEAKLVTYTDNTGKRSTFSLNSMSKQQPDISSRLKYTRDIIGKLIHVNGK